MRAYLLLQLRSIGEKYWIVPTLMALGAMVLSVVMVAVDRAVGADWLEALSWLRANQPQGARAVLSTIAGSMITVAGVTFSVTIAALATTASTFGPRLVSNFMQDRGNQITLGTFIATFLYCLMVLRTVRSAEETGAEFVPHAAVLGGLVFALASLGVLIYFIHHIPESTQITHVVARLGRQLAGKVDELYPQMLGEAAGVAVAPPSHARRDGGAYDVRPRSAGYVQYVDGDGILGVAERNDLVVELVARPGDFVTPSCVLARVAMPKEADQALLDDVRAAVVIGEYRSPPQDLMFVADRLVEVAARALSPGTNDVYTAFNAIDWLGNGLVSLVARRVPDPARRGEDGTVRIVARPCSFEEVLDVVMDRLRSYVAADPNAAVHTMATLERVARQVSSAARGERVRTHADALLAAGRERLDPRRDRPALEKAHADVLAALAAPAF